MNELLTERYSEEDRKRHIMATIATSTPRKLRSLKKSFERKLKRGHIYQELYDFVIQEIDNVTGGDILAKSV
ncbi:unnamed protein product [marine sediment metagenome]|uniref:Uncharacterized protein n=1 Tax=marine sediment metagenome TaxID=412755 RepID=X1EMT2_9ZZZZ